MVLWAPVPRVPTTENLPMRKSLMDPLTPPPPLPQRGEGEPEAHTGQKKRSPRRRPRLYLSFFLAPPLPSVGEGAGGGEGCETCSDRYNIARGRSVKGAGGGWPWTTTRSK